MTVSTGRIKDIANILKLGHIEFRTTDLVRAREFYVDLIGLHETGRDENRIYLRCTEDRQHHTFVLRQADAAGVGTIGFRVAAEEDNKKPRVLMPGLLSLADQYRVSLFGFPLATGGYARPS